MHEQTLVGRYLVRAAVIIFTTVPITITAAPLRFLNVEVSLDGLVDLKNGTNAIDRLKMNYPDLHALAIPHDAGSAPADVQYYGEVLANRAAGQYLARADLLGDPQRPHVDRDLIIFRESAPLYVVQHEALHYLIELAHRDHGAGIVAFRTGVNEVMRGGSSNDLFDLQNLRLDVLRRSSFEEVAMVDYMLAHRVDLGMSDDQAREELQFGAKYLAEAATDFRKLVTEVDRTASLSDPRRLTLFSRFAAVANDVDAVTRAFKVIACELNLR